jgi:hypothetical protein
MVLAPMCGYKSKISATPGGVTRIADANAPILKWDDPRMSQKRKKLFAVLAKMLPQAFDNPGRAAPHKQGTYKPMSCWYKGAIGTSCTAFNPVVMSACCGGKGKDKYWKNWAFEAPSHPAWVDYVPGKMPSIGDTYLLYNEQARGIRHVGIVCQIDLAIGGRWVTGDGGQNDPYTRGQCAELVPRPWKCSELTADHPDTPYLGGGAESAGEMMNPSRLMGWVNLDHESVVFINEEFDEPAESSLFVYTEADYQDLATRIATVLANP